MIGKLLLNRYELLEKIGEGGMGIVYKAKCTLLNRIVAIKILKSEFNNCEDFMSRFRREANSIASLSHPNIVNIYDVGSDNNINFIVMEYINGKTLKQIIKDSVQINTLKTLDISLQIAKALECAHKNNIIHRDIKPDNILVTENNIAKLTDFGIAKVVGSMTITNTNKIIGSVHYFSPEQAKGKFVDQRTDIYALGVVMYEMLTGQVPYNAETPLSIIMMHIQKAVTSPKEVNTDIPENMNRIILKALEKEPIDRFQTSTELAYVLNVLKENPDLEVNFNNGSVDSTILMEPASVSSNSLLFDRKIDPTFVMTQVINVEKSKINKDKKILSKNKNTSMNKKIVLAIGLIILAIIIGISKEHISKGSSTDSEPIIVESNAPKPNVTSPEYEIKLVPSLTGNTQDVAKNTIANNGFSLGNITNEYSDTVPMGVIISQSPAADTYYETTGKINLVVSQGQEITPVVQQTSENEKVNRKGNNKGNGKKGKKKK